MRHPVRLLPLVLIIAMMIVSCGQATPPSAGEPTPKASGPVSTTDYTKTEIKLDAPAEKVICLSIACVDYLAELEITPLAIRSDFSVPYKNYFGEVPSSVTVLNGTSSEPDLEQIISLGPDLVIGIANFHENLRESLKETAPLYLTSPKSHTEAIAELKNIGILTGHTEQADAASKKFTDKLATAKSKSPKDASVLILFALSDTNYFVSTDQEQSCVLFAEVAECPWTMPEQGGAMSAYGFAQYSLEQIIEKDPDHIFFAAFTKGKEDDSAQLIEQFAKNPLWGQLNAVKTKQVHTVDVWLWTGERGTRMLGTMLDEGLPILYPTVFK